MLHEALFTELLVDPNIPDYGVAVLLYSYYIPVRRITPYPGLVIEAFWADDTFHMVAFHEAKDAWEYISFAKRGAIEEYLPSEAYRLYREFQKAQETMNATELAAYMERAHGMYSGRRKKQGKDEGEDEGDVKA